VADFEAIELRVKTLERHNRSLRWTVIVTLFLSILGLMWGRLWPANGVVEARSFVVVDAAGRARGSFAFDASGVGLNLQDERGRWRTGLLVDNTGRPALFLFDTTTQPVVSLNLQRGGSPFLRMRSPEDEATFTTRLGTGNTQGLFLSRGTDSVSVTLPKSAGR
jgi:hypothetical protein